MGGVGYRGPSGVPGTPVAKTGNVRPGVKFHTPRSAGAQMSPAKMQNAARSATRSANMHKAAMARAAKKTPMAAAPVTGNKKGLLAGISNMSKRTKMGVGLGLGVAAAVTMNRRGEGASSGRQSIYRY